MKSCTPPRSAAAVLLSLILAACGGGGGGDASNAGGGSGASGTTLVPISQANYQTVGAVATDGASNVTNLNSSTALLVAGVEVTGSPFSLAGATTAIHKRFHGKGSSLVTGAVVTEACSNGGSVTIDDASANATQLTAGDRTTIAATNCKEPGLPTLNGKATFIVSSVSGDPINSYNYSVGIAVTFDGFTMQDGDESTAISGDMALVVSQSGSSTINVGLSGQTLGLTAVSSSGTETYRISSYNMALVESGGTTSLSGKYALSGSSPKLGGSYAYNVEVTQPLVSSGSSYPSSGSLVVRGSPATVTVTVLNSTSVRLDYSEKGDGVSTVTSTMSWSAFEALK